MSKRKIYLEKRMCEDDCNFILVNSSEVSAIWNTQKKQMIFPGWYCDPMLQGDLLIDTIFPHAHWWKATISVFESQLSLYHQSKEMW